MIVPEKTSLRDNAAMIRQFAELGPEWFSAVEVSWEVAGATAKAAGVCAW